jgi:hypothetical protein
MKRLLFIGCMTLTLARLAIGQTTNNFVNNGNITAPPDPIPQIDATNFLNNGLFNLALEANAFSTNVGILNTVTVLSLFEPYQFSDVLTYSNRGVMSDDTGFEFDTLPSGSGLAHRASVFGNANLGSITSGSFTNVFTTSFVFFGGSLPEMTISATNVVNTGLLDVGVDGNLVVDGVNLNLTRGTLKVEGLADFGNVFEGGLFFGASLPLGIYDNYWGIGLQTNQIQGGNYTVTNTSSPFHMVTNVLFQALTQTIVPPPTLIASENMFFVDASNVVSELVLVNTNAGVSTDVRWDSVNGFFPDTPAIQWLSTVTNNAGIVTTNTLYLEDFFGSLTNFSLVTNGISQNLSPQIAPFNFSYSVSFPGYTNLPEGNTVYNSTNFFFGAFPETNEYSAYGINILPVTFQPDPTVPGQSFTNIPGRIVINADTVLDLTRTIISGPNYLRLTSTNHFVGSTNAQINSPNMDINLGTTNGQMTISNLVAPYLPRLNGTIDAYSARWTNVIAGVTNRFYILIVDSELLPTVAPLVQNCLLRSTNVVISDLLNVASNLLINAQNLTIITNSPFSPTPMGQLNLLSPNIIWSSSLPVLQNLTNWGIISAPNTIYFAGVRQNPYYNTNFTEPYQSFVNHGSISTSGLTVWANYFENSGSGAIATNLSFTNLNILVTTNSAQLFSGFGPINIQAGTAGLTNGSLVSGFTGDITFNVGSLSISNHALLASGALNLTATNLLTDTGTNSSNFWVVADGINLPIKPTVGDLLGTTIDSTCPANLEVDNLWAGQDRGASAAGFLNNEAIGHLILDGGDAASVFFFEGPGATNAIYVDLIELRDGATNRASRFINGQFVQTYTAVDVNPGMTLYFADAIASGQDISQKLNGNLTDSGGQVIWVPSYAGFFSSTNITYPSGITYTLNRGLVDLLSPTLPFEGENIKLGLSFTTNLPKSAIITWQTLAGATNSLFTSTNLLSTNWSLVTNFVVNTSGPVSFTNSAPGTGPRYYKVSVDPVQP